MTLRLNFKVILYILLIYPFYKPYYFAQLGVMQTLNDYLYVVTFIVIIIMYTRSSFSMLFNKGFLFLSLFYLILIYSTIINAHFEFNLIILTVITFMFAMLLNYSLKNKHEFLCFLLAFKILIYTYIVLNLIVIVIYPNGIPSITVSYAFPNYLFGNTNNVIKYALPGLCFSFLYDILKYKKVKINSWFLFLLIIIILINSWSVTSILGLFVFIIVQLNKIGTRQIIISYIVVFAISLFGSLYLIFFKENSIILKYIFELFGKDMTLTNRDYLWKKTIESIEMAKVFGYGYLNEELMRFYTGNNHGSHNYYLDILIRGGTVLLTYLVIVILILSKSLYTLSGNKLTRLLIGTFAAYIVMWIAEPFMDTEAIMFGVLLILLTNINRINSYYRLLT